MVVRSHPQADPEPTPSGKRPIVVGLDGTGASRQALIWAVRYARQTHAPVKVVCTWQYPALYAAGLGVDTGDLGLLARAMVEREVAKLSAEYPGVELTSRVEEGDPGETLVEESSRAQLLVLGRHAGYSAYVPGSTTGHCLRAARCPLVIHRSPCA